MEGVRAAALAGLCGALTVTALNEGGRRVAGARAPRAEKLGIRGVRAYARRIGWRPDDRTAYRAALAAELVSNTLYYAGAGAVRRPLAGGALLGALAGAGALLLPGPLGLGRGPTRRTRTTAALSFGWYLAGGLAAGLAAAALHRGSTGGGQRRTLPAP